MKTSLFALFSIITTLAASAQVDASGFFGSASVGQGFEKGQGSKGAMRVGSADSRSHLTDAAEVGAGAYDTINDCIAVPLEIFQSYDEMFKLLGASEREAIMKRVDARWPDKVWIPRKTSTWLGSAQRVMKFWEKMGYAKKSGEIGGMVFLGLKDGKTPGQIFDLLLDTGTLKSTDFGAEGEFAFLGGSIMAGLVNGESFVDSISNAVDPEDMSFLGKIGYGWGYITSQTVIGLEKFLERNDRVRLEQLLIDNIRKAGYNEEAEKALQAWLALDDSIRAIAPFELKDEWKTNIRPEDMVCAPPSPVSETADDVPADKGTRDKTLEEEEDAPKDRPGQDDADSSLSSIDNTPEAVAKAFFKLIAVDYNSSDHGSKGDDELLERLVTPESGDSLLGYIIIKGLNGLGNSLATGFADGDGEREQIRKRNSVHYRVLSCPKRSETVAVAKVHWETGGDSGDTDFLVKKINGAWKVDFVLDESSNFLNLNKLSGK